MIAYWIDKKHAICMFGSKMLRQTYWRDIRRAKNQTGGFTNYQPYMKHHETVWCILTRHFFLLGWSLKVTPDAPVSRALLVDGDAKKLKIAQRSGISKTYPLDSAIDSANVNLLRVIQGFLSRPTFGTPKGSEHLPACTVGWTRQKVAHLCAWFTVENGCFPVPCLFYFLPVGTCPGHHLEGMCWEKHTSLGKT